MKIDLRWLGSAGLFLGSLFSIAFCVDHSKFKKCDESGFCKVNRALTPGDTPYELLTNTIQIKPTSVSAQLLNTKNNVHFKLTLTPLIDSTLRLRVEELTPLRPRFEPLFGLNGEPHPQSLELKNQTSSGFAFTFGGEGSPGFQDKFGRNLNRVDVQAKPFKVDVFSGDQLVISVNSRGLMKFDHTHRLSPNDVKEDAGHDGDHKEEVKNENELTAGDEEHDANSGEEKFGGHTDTKPFGPTSVGMDFTFNGFEHVYGIPEHADTFALKNTKNGEPYRMFNLDVFEYELDSPMALYGSIPFMIAHNEKRSVGLLWLNSAETWIDINSSLDKNVVSSIVDFVKGGSPKEEVETHWFSEAGIIDTFIFLGPTPVNLFSQYAKLVGTTQLPPLFTLGYHQCRWNYNDQEDVREVVEKFDEHDIPLDFMWLDIEYSDGKKYFVWDHHKFPDPNAMIDRLQSTGRKLVSINDPHIKKETGYFVYDQALAAGDYIVKDKHNNDYDGWCWPGSSVYLDYFNPAVVEFYAKLYLEMSNAYGHLSHFTWNDMNEPSVFNGPELTLEKDAKHFGGWEHREVHNAYGFMQTKSTNMGQLMKSNNRNRPFILTRSFFVGSQRYTSVWTGDNQAKWEHLRISIPMLLSLSVSGMSFCGADIGGFFFNPEPELLYRWYQAGAFQPFMRAHAHIETKRREPWLFPEVMQLIRDAIRKRQSWLPLWYALFKENEQTGLPPMRPIWLHFPEDKAAYAIQDQYLLGDVLLVHPVTEPGVSSVDVYFPGRKQVWYDVDTWQRFDNAGLVTIPVTKEKIPVYQRGGTIVARKERIRRSTELTYRDPYTLYVALDKSGKMANGTIYVDDGYTFDYKDGKYIRSLIHFDNKFLSAIIANNQPAGAFTSEAWIEKIVIVGLQSAPSSCYIEIEGQPRTRLDINYESSLQLLTIRKPGALIGSAWTVTLEQ